MTEVDVLFAGVPVTDFRRAVDWYEKLFGRSAEIVVIADEEVMWRLGGEAWVYVVHDESRAGKSLVTLCVFDLDGNLADIGRRGISPGPVVQVGENGRKSVVFDPDGNSVSFIEVADPTDDSLG